MRLRRGSARRARGSGGRRDRSLQVFRAGTGEVLSGGACGFARLGRWRGARRRPGSGLAARASFGWAVTSHGAGLVGRRPIAEGGADHAANQACPGLVRADQRRDLAELGPGKNACCEQENDSGKSHADRSNDKERPGATKLSAASRWQIKSRRIGRPAALVNNNLTISTGRRCPTCSHAPLSCLQ